MKILVTGSGGQLGTQCCEFLQHKGEDHIGYNSSELDITSLENIHSVLDRDNPDIIINCAAYTAVDQAEEHRARADAVNHLALGHLAAAGRQRGIKVVHFSTDYVFPGQASHKDKYPEGYREDSETEPVNYYGITKWKGEEALRNSGCEHLIIRVSWLCGQYGSNFLKSMLRLAEGRESLDVVGDQWGSPSFASEVITNTHILLDKRLSGTYHITSGGMTTWADFAAFIFECAGKNIDVQAIPTSGYPTKAKRPKFSKLSTRKAQLVEGITITHWKRGTQDLINQLNNH